MPGQLFSVSTQGTYTWSTLLSREVVHAAQPDKKFAQFTVMREQWGKNAGESFLFDKYGNIDTQGTTLSETSTIPAHQYRLYQSTATLYERGNSIPWTRKYEVLSQTNERAAPVQVLKNDMAKALDTACEAEFDKCKIRYVGTATNVAAWTTNGTATSTCKSDLNTTHVKNIVDYMYETMLCPPYDGQNYMAIVSSNAARGVYDEVEDIMQYTKFPASGEFGKYYDCRFVKTNHGLSNTGNASTYGEAYFFGGGEGPVCEGVAVPPQVIPKEVTDYGRSKGLAWYCINGYKIFWEDDPDNNTIKYDSA